MVRTIGRRARCDWFDACFWKTETLVEKTSFFSVRVVFLARSSVVERGTERDNLVLSTLTMVLWPVALCGAMRCCPYAGRGLELEPGSAREQEVVG